MKIIKYIIFFLIALFLAIFFVLVLSTFNPLTMTQFLRIANEDTYINMKIHRIGTSLLITIYYIMLISLYGIFLVFNNKKISKTTVKIFLFLNIILCFVIYLYAGVFPFIVPIMN